ncbi:MAG: integrase catalytic subunit [bacterium]|nr:MAG: integrase catalytic subunit [bacterium]
MVKQIALTQGQDTTTKQAMAQKLGVARSTLYYQPKLKSKDQLLKEQIKGVWKTFPAYGHKRLALALKVNKKRMCRVMKLFGLKPPRRRSQKPVKPEDIGKPEIYIPNLLLDENRKPIVVTKPDFAWSQDFTYLNFNGKWHYVATVIDLYTREI